MAPMDEIETLGKYLRKERESRNVSLRELSKNTRVREPILKAIEEDRYDLLPSLTFVKGFLTAYAKYIGLDSSEVILRYQQTLKGVPEADPAVASLKEIGRKSRRRWLVGGITLGGVVLLGVIIAYFFFQPPVTRVQTPPAKPEQEERATLPPVETAPVPSQPLDTLGPQAAGTSPPKPSLPQSIGTSPPVRMEGTNLPASAGTSLPASPSPSPTGGANTPAKENPISLQIKATETTWLSVRVDGQAERQMTLRAGESIPVEGAGQIYILVGNAGGLDLIQNGKPLESFGKSGDVVALTFTRHGLDVKRFEKQKPH